MWQKDWRKMPCRTAPFELRNHLFRPNVTERYRGSAACPAACSYATEYFPIFPTYLSGEFQLENFNSIVEYNRTPKIPSTTKLNARIIPDSSNEWKQISRRSNAEGQTWIHQRRSLIKSERIFLCHIHLLRQSTRRNNRVSAAILAAGEQQARRQIK